MDRWRVRPLSIIITYNLIIMKKQTFKHIILLLMGCLAIVACSDDNIQVTPPVPQSGPQVFTAIVTSITVDPSGFCPLAARIRINTSGGMAIRATVQPKPNSVTPAQEHLFPYSAEPVQFIDVLGLYSNYTNQVKLAFLDAQGIEHADTLVEIKVDSLNIPNVPQVRRVLKADVSRMEPGVNLALFTPNGDNDTSMPYMVDADGEIRYLLNWRNSEKMIHTIFNAGFSRMKDGNWLVGDNNRGVIRTVNLLGEVIQTYDLPATNGYKFHHETREMINGHLISCMTQQNALCADGITHRIRDQIVEWNPKNGIIVHEWDLVNMLDPARFGVKVLGVSPAGQSVSNWVHNNAIADWGDNYLSCSRYQGVFKFKPSGELMWILAPHRGWRDQYQKYLLTPLDHDGNVITNPTIIDGAAYTDDFDWVWGPHAPVVLPGADGNSKRHRILVFDNGLARNFIRNNQQTPYSRAVIYEIDEENMTVRQVWDYGSKDMPEYYASSRSNAGYLPQTGHILFALSEGVFLSNGKSGSCVLEIDPASNEIIYRMELENAGGFHRMYRLPLYPD